MDEAERQRRDELIEAEMAADEAAAETGEPLKRTPEEGIQAMQERIEYLQRRLKELAGSGDPMVTEACRFLERDLSNARLKLAEYQILHEGRN